MSYIRHHWVNGEVLDAPKMNNIEDQLELLSEESDIATDADCDSLFVHFLEDDE